MSVSPLPPPDSIPLPLSLPHLAKCLQGGSIGARLAGETLTPQCVDAMRGFECAKCSGDGLRVYTSLVPGSVKRKVNQENE
eukprot:2369983-Rhodomonas_salina.2